MPPAESQSPAVLPPSAEHTPIFTSGLPSTGSAAGALVEGFPRDVVPVLPGSAIENTSLASNSGILQLGLVANTEAPMQEILAFYRDRLARIGFTSVAADALPGSTATLFTSGPHRITVTVREPGAGSHYTVFGVFHAEG